MTRRATVLALLLAMIALPLAPLSAQGQGRNNTPANIAIPIVGTGSGLAFVGTFDLQRFIATDGGVSAVGTLTGTLTNTVTGVVTSIVRNIVIPVTVGQATCDILHLDLGPLSLDLLGLQVDLSRVVLDITAQTGAGNLLGNLLCAVAGLLDQPDGLARLLNRILDQL